MKNFKFYYKPFIIIQLLNLIIFILFGSYLEEYEGFYSTAIEGIYTKQAQLGWDTDTHFLLVYIYTWLARFTTEINSYGVILFLYSCFSLSLLGLVIYRVLRVNLSNNSLILFIILYSILSVDSMINLNGARQAFIFITAILGYIESKRFENKSINKIEWVGIFLFILFISLIRFESVLLFSILYIILLFIHKRFVTIALLPFIISGSVYFSYNLLYINYSSKEKKVFIYKEREIFDRYNIDYGRLTELQKLDVDALMQYSITDKEHFDINFYDSISRKNSMKGALSLFNGFNYGSLNITWMISSKNYYAARYYYIFYLISGLLVFFANFPGIRRYMLHYILLALVPLLLCFYTVVPLRFLIPFLSFAGCLNIFIYLKHQKKYNAILFYCIIILLVILIGNIQTKKVYLQKEKEYVDFADKLQQLSKKQPSTPVVLNGVFPNNYFPIKPFKLYKQHAVFLNFYLFSADDYHIQTWKELCHCNTFSLKERVDYVITSQNLFLIDDHTFEFLRKYFQIKYHVRLQRKVLGVFDKNLKVCKLNYVIENN